MKCPARSTALILLLLLSRCPSAFAAWTTVGTGIEYQKFTLTDPNNVFVARMLRADSSATIETSMPQGKLSGVRETVRSQSSRLDDAVNYWGGNWGGRNDVVVAVNGDWFYSSGLVYGGVVHSGWYAKPIYCEFGGSQFAWTMDRVPFIGTCTHNTSQNLSVRYVAAGLTQIAQGLNRARGADELIIYTPQYDATTKTDNTGTEVVLEMTTPALLKSGSGSVKGYVREIRQGQGSTPIPFDCVVISASGSQVSTLINSVSIGSEVSLSLYVDAYEYPACTTPLSFNLTNTYASIGGGHIVLHNNVVQDHSADAVMAARHPRTAVAYNSTYIFLIVCDGRSTISRGMTGIELGNFCKDTLGATYALNLDGGGSSTMVVNGSVMNVPSDGSERAVGNGLMMLNVLPKSSINRFCEGQYVTTTSSTSLYLGPGTNYATNGTLTNGTTCVIANHSLNGVLAKGSNWWKIRTGIQQGWVTDSSLNPYGTLAPSISEHPAPATICPGMSQTMSVSAVGSGTLTYQWQRDGINLSNGSYYSGTTERILTITNADSTVTGNYRCRINNTYGYALSNYAALALKQAPTVSIEAPSVPYTRTGPVTFNVVYTSADSILLTTANVTLNKTGTATGTVDVSGSGNTNRTITISNIRGNGNLSVSIPAGTAYGCGSTPASGPSTPVIVDNASPGTVVVTDEGMYTPSLTTLKANWTQAADSGSGISHYQYGIGTYPGLMDVVPWTVWPNNTLSVNTLSLTEGNSYYFIVRAVDRVGIFGPSSISDGILAAPGITKIGGIWSLDNTTPLSLRGKTVTAAFGNSFWLEEQDRSAAVKVLSSEPQTSGNTVDVAGVLGMSGSHRALIGDVVYSHSVSSSILPLGMRIKELGGNSFNAFTPGVDTALSLYNIGILVRCCGIVTYRNTDDPNNKYFYFDDGSTVSGGPHPGVLVRCGTIEPPSSSMTAVTGIVSSEQSGTTVVPVILIRNSSDIQSF